MFSRRSIEPLTKRKHDSSILIKLGNTECLVLFDPRSLGFYSAFNAVGQLLLALYHGGMNPTGMVVEPGGVAIHLILLVAFGLLAVHLIMPAPATQRLTGWFLLVASLVIILLAFLGVLGLA